MHQFHKIHVVKQFEFRCSKCGGWWSINDVHNTNTTMFYCPWCGVRSKLTGPGVGHGTDEDEAETTNTYVISKNPEPLSSDWFLKYFGVCLRKKRK